MRGAWQWNEVGGEEENGEGQRDTETRTETENSHLQTAPRAGANAATSHLCSDVGVHPLQTEWKMLPVWHVPWRTQNHGAEPE